MRGKRYSIDLPAHMAECDSNYLRLIKLFPALKKVDSLKEQDSSAIGVELNGHSLEVRLEVLERSPYTTLVKINQRSDVSADVPADTPTDVPLDVPPEMPWNGKASMTVRLYHDARSAEVVEYQGKRHFLRAVYDYPNVDMRHPDEKAQINRFLGEYLSHCLTHGVAAGAPVLAN